MSILYLVRHGQASFFAEDYDRLSALGELQARRLGEYFACRGIRFDAVYTGPAVRQRRTAEILVEAMASAGGAAAALPALIDGLNEHAGDKLLSLPQARLFFERHPELGALEDAFRAARDPGDVQKNFQNLFEAVVLRWTKGETMVPGVESWHEFHDRVRRAIASITSHAEHGRNVLAVSSVGPISVAVQTALETSIPVGLQVGWRLRNSSVTTFIYSQGRMTLDGFNAVAHLANADEITYR